MVTSLMVLALVPFPVVGHVPTIGLNAVRQAADIEPVAAVDGPPLTIG